MTSEIENDKTETEGSVDTKIKDLKPRMKSIDVTFKVLEKGEVREVTSRHRFETHRIADAVVGDETGIVKLPLWNETISNIEVGKTYKLENGYTGLFRGYLQLKIGRHSEIKAIDDEISEINLDVDMSAEPHRPSQPRHYYQPYPSSRTGGEANYSTRGRRDRDSRYSRYGRRNRRW